MALRGRTGWRHIRNSLLGAVRPVTVRGPYRLASPASGGALPAMSGRQRDAQGQNAQRADAVCRVTTPSVVTSGPRGHRALRRPKESGGPAAGWSCRCRLDRCDSTPQRYNGGCGRVKGGRWWACLWLSSQPTAAYREPCSGWGRTEALAWPVLPQPELEPTMHPHSLPQTHHGPVRGALGQARTPARQVR